MSNSQKKNNKKYSLKKGEIDELARIFKVLGDPTRLSLLERLRSDPATVGELVESLGGKQANTSKQLALLFNAGLVSRARDGNQVRYKIKHDLLEKLCSIACQLLHSEAKERLHILNGP